MSLDARVTIFPNRSPGRPWVLLWSSEHHLARYCFRTWEEAVQVGRQIIKGPGLFEPHAVYSAKAPFPLFLTEDLQRDLEHADFLLSQALTRLL